jgi:hypothetical protein
MLFRLSTWRPEHLLAAWCAYWLALPLIWIAPALPTLYRVSKPDAHGNASLSYGDGAFRYVVSAAGQPDLTSRVGVTTTLVLAAIPPLVLWALWLRAQRRARESIGA